jgi:hypothetical protein
MGLFVCKRIVLGVKRVENGRSRVLWCDVIVFNYHAPTEDKISHMKNSLYEELDVCSINS